MQLCLRSKQCFRAAGFLAFVLPLLLTSGCAYRTKNALPPHMRTIAVPVFTNRTYLDEYSRKIEVEVTDAVRTTFLEEGELKIAGREDADLILEGAIMRVDREILRVDRFGDPAEVRFIIRARLSVYDVKEARYIFKDQTVENDDRKPESGVYSLRRGESEEFAKKQALKDIGRQIARRVTERW